MTKDLLSTYPSTDITYDVSAYKTFVARFLCIIHLNNLMT